MKKPSIKKPLLIVIDGETATGKTALSIKISKKFNIPVVGKDQIKEKLFDELGLGDREWSYKLGQAGFELMYWFSEKLLAIGQSHVIETAFSQKKASGRIKQLLKKYKFKIVQINCNAGKEIIVKRFKKRWESGERHRGHIDYENYNYVESIDGKRGGIKIPGSIIYLDTSDFKKIDYKKLFSDISKKL